MSFEVISHLVDKTVNKGGVDQVINYMNTNPLFMNKPHINKETKHEPSIRAFYKIETVDNGVDPTAYAKFTRDKYHTQDLHFKNYSKKTLINDLESGHSNYANDFLEFKKAYLNNDGKPLIRNNTMLAGLYMNENNTPKNVPFNYPGPSIAAGPDPYYEPPVGGGLPDPGPSGGAPDPDPASIPLPDSPKPYIGKAQDTEENKKAATTLQRVGRGRLGKKGIKDEVKDQMVMTTSGTYEELNANVTERKSKLGYEKVEVEDPKDKSKKKVVYKKLEGVTPVKASTSAQPVEASTSSQPVQAKPEPEQPDSPKSDDTTTDESKNMADHKFKLLNNYKLPNNVTKLINYTGTTKDKYAILDDIAKVFYNRAYREDKKVEYENEFISLITTDTTSDTGKRGLKSSSNLQKVLKQVEDMKKRK